ncbi:unnamed protein product [Cuscuta campestris]|uniref:J domain-containing protein n=2 Tax=Cuscuta sect. Cleistogrammica TaxID=1824901 RepID=A0A484LQP0_9ASTE|nr:hypothetical protein DM860_003143 [Cuscuta australis]VFQ78238.1 unnamed protein product [Cuscuta campestris]
MEHPFFINANSNRAEAIRWFSIAEKLLNTRDLLGSRSFATRARDCDPTLLQAEQIIAIADTLLAGEKRINNQHCDWYGILQVPPNQRHDGDFIANQYHRLALLLSPNKNNFPLADQALRLVVEAWSLLSNRFRKSLYDEEIGFFLTLNQEPAPPPPASQPSAFNVFPNSGREQQQQQMLFASREQQPMSAGQSFLTSMQQQQQQSSSSRGQQPGMFLNRDQQQQVTSIPSLNRDPQPPETYIPSSTREPHMISFGSSPDRGEQLRAASVQDPPPDHHRNTQPQYEGFVGNTNDNIFGSSIDDEANKEKEMKVDEPKIDIPSFWTACPYCYHMFEYPDVYVDCTLRCRNCRMAYQAIATSSPPPIIDGKDAYFCCWGFIPLGFSVADWERNRNRATSWSPFSPMFTCPINGGKNGVSGGKTANYTAVGQKDGNSSGGFHSVRAPKGGSAGQKNVTPRMDDGGGHLGSGGGCGENDEPVDSGGVSNEDWHDGRARKKARNVNEKGVNVMTPPSRSVQKHQAENGKNGNGNNTTGGKKSLDGLQVQGGGRVTTEATKKGIVGNARRQFGRIARDYGKLDLNVEFSNDGEDHQYGMGGRGHGTGRGVDDNIEGIGFFEGLDEFLSSLPILNVVGEDKVKAA